MAKRFVRFDFPPGASAKEIEAAPGGSSRSMPRSRRSGMTLKEAATLAQKQADEFGVTTIVVRDDLSEDAGGYECCAEMYRETLYPDHHQQFWEIVGRCEPTVGR